MPEGTEVVLLGVQRKWEKIREAEARRAIGYTFPETQRDAERSTLERVNARLKDEFGTRNLLVRGHLQAFCHVMFGVPALTVRKRMKIQT